MSANSGTERGGRGARCRVAALAALAALACGCSAPLKAPLLLHPVPPTVADYALEQGALVFSGPDFTVCARPWDYRLVAARLREEGVASPFGETDQEVGRFVFFRVRLENRSPRSLVFNPMRASLRFAGETPLSALENSDFFAFAGEDIAGAEARGQAFRKVSFDITATVPAGATLERYLVFPAPKEASKTAVLRLDELWLGARSHDLAFTFEAFPGK